MTTPSDRPQRPRRQRREPVIPTAPVALDERGVALSTILSDVFADFDMEVGAAVDEVTLTVQPGDVPAVCRIARQHPDIDCGYLRCLSVVDYVERLEVNYHLFSLEKRHKFVVKTNVSPDEPTVPSIVSVWRGADWFEREAHDLFGVEFEGHPGLLPLLLYDGFEGFPGRKSFPFHDYDEW